MPSKNSVNHQSSAHEEENARRRLEELVGEYVDRLNAGEELDPVKIIQAYPDLAADLLRELETFEAINEHSESENNLGTLGDYTLRRQIGRGGMGVVYDAWQNSMNRQVALKVLPTGVAADRKAFLRFMREAQTAGQLSHQNVVAVHSTGVEQGTPWYAMEYVEGETLAQVLVRIKEADAGTETAFGKKDEGDYFVNMARAFADVADGLQHAHSKGVIHRDIKPSNFIMDTEGRLRILDFGLARLEGQESLTISGDVVGTPLYMSPEQARQRKIGVDHRTDVYSLGATIYEVLTGRPPFKGKNHQDTLSQIIERDPVAPRKLNQRVPNDLETIVLKCLRKDPGDRYGTAEALGQDLTRFVRGAPIEARAQSRFEVLSRKVWRHRRALGVAVLVCFLLLSTGLLLYNAAVRKREKLATEYEELVQQAALSLQDLTFAAGVESDHFRLLDPSGALGGELRDLIPSLFGKQAGVHPAPDKDPIATLVNFLDYAVTLLPERPEAHYFKAKAYLLLKRRGEARAALDRALDNALDFVPARFLRDSLSTEEGGQADRAERGGDFADGSWQSLWLRAHMALEESRWQDVARSLGELYRLHRSTGGPYAGGAVEMLLERCRARLEAGDFGKAILDIGVARFLWPDALAPDLLLAKAYHFDGQRERAEETFQELSERSQSKVPLGLLIGNFYFSQRYHEEGVKWAKRLLPDGPIRKAFVAFGLNRLRRFDEAESLARQAIEEAPQLFFAQLELADALRLKGKTDPKKWLEAQGMYEKLAKSNPHNALVYAAHAEGLIDACKYEKAHRLLDEAIRLEPDSYFACCLRGCAYAYQGKYREAEGVFREILKRHPRRPMALCWLGHVLTFQGRYEEAVVFHQKVIALNPDVPAAHQGLGLAQLKLKQAAHGISSYCRAIELAPQALGLYNILISYLAGETQLDCAEELGQLIEVIIENVPNVREDLTQCYALEVLVQASLHAPSVENLLRAERCLRAAVEKTEAKERARLSLLATVLFQKGERVEAIRLLERARHLPCATVREMTYWKVEEQLAGFREDVWPDLPTYQSVDAALARGDREAIIAEGEAWRFFPGVKEPSTEPLVWIRPDFDHSQWEEGESGFGYGHRTATSVLDDMQGRYSSFYIRKEFWVEEPSRYERILLRVFADDGFLAYLNGKSIGHAGVRPGIFPFNGVAEGIQSPWIPSVVELEPSRLLAGRNVLAIQGLNHGVGDFSFYLLPILFGELPFDPWRDEKLREAFGHVATGEDAAERLAYLEGRMHQRAGNYTEAARVFRELTASAGSATEPTMRLAETLLAVEATIQTEDIPQAALLSSRRRDLWEHWIALALKDPQRQPADILEDFPFPQADPDAGDHAGVSRPIEDLHWLLQKLAAGDDLRINCGGQDDVDADGREWSRDRFFRAGLGIKSPISIAGIQAIEKEIVYKSGRYFQPFPTSLVKPVYRFPLRPGEYRVTLYFALIGSKKPSRLDYSVLVEGKPVLREDQPEEQPIEKVVVQTRVEDGLLDIGFMHGDVGNTVISAIEISCIR